MRDRVGTVNLEALVAHMVFGEHIVFGRHRPQKYNRCYKVKTMVVYLLETSEVRPRPTAHCQGSHTVVPRATASSQPIVSTAGKEDNVLG